MAFRRKTQKWGTHNESKLNATQKVSVVLAFVSKNCSDYDSHLLIKNDKQQNSLKVNLWEDETYNSAD